MAADRLEEEHRLAHAHQGLLGMPVLGWSGEAGYVLADEIGALCIVESFR